MSETSRTARVERNLGRTLAIIGLGFLATAIIRDSQRSEKQKEAEMNQQPGGFAMVTSIQGEYDLALGFGGVGSMLMLGAANQRKKHPENISEQQASAAETQRTPVDIPDFQQTSTE